MTSNPDILQLPPREVREDEPETAATTVRIEVADVCPADPTPEQVMRLVETSGTLDFWEDPGEDIYTLEDGEPL